MFENKFYITIVIYADNLKNISLYTKDYYINQINKKPKILSKNKLNTANSNLIDKDYDLILK